jgi:NADH:ubiquinone reductase (H+-translocating)
LEEFFALVSPNGDGTKVWARPSSNCCLPTILTQSNAESSGESKLEEEQTMAQQATGVASQDRAGEPDRPLIVIVGGGFAAVQFAKTLRKELPVSECDILLYNCENHMVFHPLLADVAGASINLDAAVAPLRQMLPGVECRTQRIVRIDLPVSEIVLEDENGALTHLHYDHVVIACGAESNLGIIPGMTEYAFPFKVMRDAIELRQHIVRQMEQAEAVTDPDRQRWHLSFIVVGAGFSGVEVAGEINELVRSSTRFYRNFRKEDVVVTMVHSQDQILPEVAPPLRQFAHKKMEKAGVTILLNSRAVGATHEGVVLKDGQMLRGGTIVCTIGTTISPLIQTLNAPKEKGRIRTTPEMRVEGQANAWAVGDCALITNAFDNKPSPTTAQFAQRQGRQAALNLVRVLKGKPAQPFRFKALGQLCSIGGYSAVAEVFGLHMSGFLAWLLWRGVYLFKLPTWSRRIKVALDWGWDVLFPRDLSYLNTDTTRQITHAYYRSGDFIHRQGELARVFSVIEEGEVEIVQATEQNPEPKLVAVLGKADFFGEAALIGNRPHETSVRARTAVRLAQVGRDLFSEITGSFAPIRDLLTKAVVDQAGDLWRRLPVAKTILEDEPLASLLEPLPAQLLRKENTLGEAIKVLNEGPTSDLIIVDEDERLWGTLDRDDLYRIIARIAVTSTAMSGLPIQHKLSEFKSLSRLYVTLDDSTLVATATMMDHGISWLPVVRSKDDLRPVGSLRGDKITYRIIQKIAQTEVNHAQIAN